MAYTVIDDSSKHVQALPYTGSGGSQSVATVGYSDMQPDYVMTMSRSSQAYNNLIYDSSRGNTYVLEPNASGAQAGPSSGYDLDFASDGISFDGGWGHVNYNGVTYCAWLWKANGGTTSSNTDGSITSTVQANTDAGFSIVTYTGTGSSGTVGHGLGAKPAMIWNKGLDGGNWNVQHVGLSTFATDTYYLNVNFNAGSDSTVFGAEPTTSVHSVGTSSASNNSGETHISYCWAEVKGFSKFGRYIGTGDSTYGFYIYTGLQPEIVFIRNVSRNGDGAGWIYDGRRTPHNIITAGNLRFDSLSAESTQTIGSGKTMDMYSDGFRVFGTNNESWNYPNDTYVYAAWARHPFVTSGGVPVTAR